MVIMFHRCPDWEVGATASINKPGGFFGLGRSSSISGYDDQLHPAVFIQLDLANKILNNMGNQEAMQRLRDLLMQKMFLRYTEVRDIRNLVA